MAQQTGQTIGQAVADAIVPGVIATAGDHDRVQSERAAGRVSAASGQPPRPGAMVWPALMTAPITTVARIALASGPDRPRTGGAMYELTGETVRGLPVPADLKAAGTGGARLAYTEPGAPPGPSRIARSLLRHPLVTLAVMRFGAGTLAPAVKLIKAGEIEPSMTRFARGVLGGQAFEGLPDEVRGHMRANASTHAGQFFADGGFEPITEAEIRSVTAPALVVTGESSPVFLRRFAALLASLLPNSRRLDVPSASHVMHLENPAVVSAALLRFLAGEAEHPPILSKWVGREGEVVGSDTDETLLHAARESD